jgi:hypothetical protein
VIIAAAALVGLLGACASTELAYHDFEDESLRLIVRTAPGARIEADYWVTIDTDDPVGTVLSIGSSIAKASMVGEAQAKMDRALRDVRIDYLLEDEVGGYFQDVMEMRITDSSRRASYILDIDVHEYGIEATGPGSGVDFVLTGSAELIDNYDGDRIWRRGFRRTEQVSPAFFGLPRSAGNVLSAAMLNELTEEQIADGIERVARDAAWQIAERFEDDLYWARRNK